jgi:hypothetical protein
MKTGLLWYDDDPGRDLAEKIGRAARRYRQKFGAPANVCYVHPSALGNNGRGKKVGGVHVSSKPSVLRHHFWVGQEEERRRRRTMKSERN